MYDFVFWWHGENVMVNNKISHSLNRKIKEYSNLHTRLTLCHKLSRVEKTYRGSSRMLYSLIKEKYDEIYDLSGVKPGSRICVCPRLANFPFAGCLRFINTTYRRES